MENCIGDFIVALKVAAAAIRRSRLESEAWARRRQEERKQREEQQRRAEEHKRRAEFVSRLIENWEEANRVRTFVMALTEAASQTECSDEKRNEIQQVLDWTTEYADLLDPLTDLPGSVEEFVHPELKYPWLKSNCGSSELSNPVFVPICPKISSKTNFNFTSFCAKRMVRKIGGFAARAKLKVEKQ